MTLGRSSPRVIFIAMHCTKTIARQTRTILVVIIQPTIRELVVESAGKGFKLLAGTSTPIVGAEGTRRKPGSVDQIGVR